MTTEITTEAVQEYSFFDLIKKTHNIDPEISFKIYTDFLDKKHTEYDNLSDQIKAFWNDSKTSLQHTDIFTMPWVNLTELAESKKELSEGKNSLNAFKKLIDLKTTIKIEDFSTFNYLDIILPNFKEVTDYYRGAFFLNQSRSEKNYEAPKPILLLGSPGIGKTYYAKQLAKIFNTSYQFIDGNSISSSWVLSGHNKGWQSADAGLIFKMMAKCPTISPILLIDEFDKLSCGKNYDPYSTFHQMFEKENAKEFYDEYINIAFNASQIIYILTANDKNAISPTLLSRMTVFDIRNPSVEEMRKIIPSIYSSVLNESKLFKDTLKDNEIEKLIKYTPREVTQIISHNVYTQASRHLKNNKKRRQDLIIENLLANNKKLIGF